MRNRKKFYENPRSNRLPHSVRHKQFRMTVGARPLCGSRFSLVARAY
ncbi:hypothetical protein BIFADO_00372 [Bifidobacterium adolescentis L2-32]|uniref:Uncharacterized protein n=1 Tax=Bifidobacterium adolescentis L2-32 TaxID=411481 RepID=A7A3I2_BIFAD|nr:hypothetical protein BIFADO_00372 [Bifidobacterium adolescentis L2-32]